MTRPSDEIRNFAASVHDRLLALARARGADFNLMLQRYAAERFLYRLGLSSEVAPVAGVAFLALRPQDPASYIEFAAGISAGANAKAAQALVAFLQARLERARVPHGKKSLRSIISSSKWIAFFKKSMPWFRL